MIIRYLQTNNLTHRIAKENKIYTPGIVGGATTSGGYSCCHPGYTINHTLQVDQRHFLPLGLNLVDAPICPRGVQISLRCGIWEASPVAGPHWHQTKHQWSSQQDRLHCHTENNMGLPRKTAITQKVILNGAIGLRVESTRNCKQWSCAIPGESLLTHNFTQLQDLAIIGLWLTTRPYQVSRQASLRLVIIGKTVMDTCRNSSWRCLIDLVRFFEFLWAKIVDL